MCFSNRNLKPFSTFPFIAHGSSHPPSNSKAWIGTVLIRRARLSSSLDVFLESIDTFRSALNRRGYPNSFLIPIWNRFLPQFETYRACSSATHLSIATFTGWPTTISEQVPLTCAEAPVIVLKSTFTLRHIDLRLSDILRQFWLKYELEDIMKRPFTAFYIAPNTSRCLSSHHHIIPMAFPPRQDPQPSHPSPNDQVIPPMNRSSMPNDQAIPPVARSSLPSLQETIARIQDEILHLDADSSDITIRVTVH